MCIRVFSASGSYTLTKVWIGFRSLYGKAAADVFSNFSPLQEAESGTAVTGAMYTDTDSNTSPNGAADNCWRVTSVPATLNAAADWYKNLDTTSKAYARGKYLVLGRMKVDSGTVGVELSYGPDCQSATPKAIFRNEMQYVANTSWNLIELGAFNYPFFDRGLPITTLPESGRMGVRIVQISGTTTSFELDCLILIPAERMIKADNCNAGNTSNGSYTGFFENEEDRPIALNMSWSLSDYYPSGKPDATFTNWGWPWDGGLMVIAAQRSTGHTLADTCTVYTQQQARYRAFIV